MRSDAIFKWEVRLLPGVLTTSTASSGVRKGRGVEELRDVARSQARNSKSGDTDNVVVVAAGVVGKAVMKTGACFIEHFRHGVDKRLSSA